MLTKKMFSLKTPISKQILILRRILSRIVRYALLSMTITSAMLWAYGLISIFVFNHQYAGSFLYEILGLSHDTVVYLLTCGPFALYVWHSSEKHPLFHIKPMPLTLNQKKSIQYYLENAVNDPVNIEIMDYCAAVKADDRELCQFDYQLIDEFIFQERKKNDQKDHSEVDQKIDALIKPRYEQKALENTIKTTKESIETLNF